MFCFFITSCRVKIKVILAYCNMTINATKVILAYCNMTINATKVILAYCNMTINIAFLSI